MKAAPTSVRLSVVMPAFNEESRLPSTLRQSIDYLQSQPYKSEIIIVDDGSRDRTCEVARGYSGSAVPVSLLSHPDGANHGKGASIKRGMLSSKGEYRLFMDADNSTTLDQIANFWLQFERGCDVAIGSRALGDSSVSTNSTNCPS